MKKYKKVFFSGMALLLIILVLNYQNIEALIYYNILQYHNRGDDTSQKMANTLSRTKMGIKLCLRDIDVYGGSTRGWSSWVLIHSDADLQYIIKRLESIVHSQEGKAKKIEALLILWKRTKEDRYLVQLFSLIRQMEPNDSKYTLERGRKELFVAMERPKELEKVFAVPPESNIEMTTEEFQKYCESIYP